MKAVVTGGAGFIGSALVDRLLDEGNDVVVVDALSESSGREDFLRPHFGKEGFSLDETNVLDLSGLRLVVMGADVIFHLAAQTGKDQAQDPVKVQMANTTGTLNVLLAAKNAGVKRVICSSSSSVYGKGGPIPLKETDPAIPSSPLGSSNLAAEEYCRLFHDLYGLGSIPLRFFNVFGPRMGTGSVIGSNAERILRGHRPLIYGDGGRADDYLFVSDAVEAILRCSAGPDLKGQPLNVCSGSATTSNQLVTMMLEAAGRADLKPEYLPSRPEDEMHMVGDNSLAKDLLGWEPRIPIGKGLDELMEWYKKTGSRPV